MARSRLQKTPVMAMCGPKTDGVSRQSSPLAMFQTEGEDSGGEEKSEADMSEERNAEGGEIKIYALMKPHSWVSFP